MPRALSNAVRKALPPAEWANSPQWEHGRRTFNPPDASADTAANPTAPTERTAPSAPIPPMAQFAGNAAAAPLRAADAQPVLQALSWRFLGAGKHAGRSVGQWQFQGHAELRGKRIDFYGEYLRDDATHALREFKLSAPACPAA